MIFCAILFDKMNMRKMIAAAMMIWTRSVKFILDISDENAGKIPAILLFKKGKILHVVVVSITLIFDTSLNRSSYRNFFSSFFFF